ncbi:zinc knuckle CX2CX4HX4C containing protein [Tanacetum coccineum]
MRHPVSAACGRIAMVSAKISKALAGADQKDLMRKLPKFIYDEEKALEKTRKILTEKITQLNSAIDVSAQLRADDPPNGSSVPINESVDINKSTSYAGVAGGSAKDQPNVNSNFRTLVADPVFDGVNISIPRKVVEKVSTRFEHTLYGYFIGKRMAFPVVEYYARNNWAKHGLKRIMMNSKGFFFFKFDSRAGLEAVLEGGLG